MKRPLFLVVAMIISLATVSAPVSALTAEQSAAISNHCATIRQSLKSLQRSDAATRVHLGTTYQTLLGSYITPLNLRLVRGNRPVQSLSDLQTDFVSTRTEFNNQFVEYSKALEDLIAVDCAAQPEQFYDQLEHTRALRAVVDQSAADLSALLDQHLASVAELKELKNPQEPAHE